MEHKIGEIFNIDNEWYQCIRPEDGDKIDCNTCDFQCSKNCKFSRCNSGYRSDKTSVIFKKLEKVGEPYIIGNKLIQRYKIYPTTYHLNVYGWYYHNLNVKSWTIDIEIKQTKEDMEENYKAEDTPLTRLVGRYVNNLIDYKTFEEAVKELFFDKKDSKPTLKPFDLEAAKACKPVCTRDGRKARIICFDRRINRPIIALIESDNHEEALQCYFDNGRCCCDVTSGYDLMMLPEEREGWVNVYKGGLLDTKSYNTRKEAFDKACPRDYVDTVKISWHE